MNEDVIAEFNMKEIKKENLVNYKKAGIWALWAENKAGKRVFLEVCTSRYIY